MVTHFPLTQSDIESLLSISKLLRFYMIELILIQSLVLDQRNHTFRLQVIW